MLLEGWSQNQQQPAPAFLDVEAEICECGGRANTMRCGKTILTKFLVECVGV